MSENQGHVYFEDYEVFKITKNEIWIIKFILKNNK